MKKYLYALLLMAFSNFGWSNDLIDPKNKNLFQNGCGTGWNSYLVPDNIPLAACKLTSACNAHDVCYSKCIAPENISNSLCQYKKCLKSGSDEDICGSPAYARIEKLAYDRKQTCDNDFYNQIINENPNKPICQNFARLYKFAVAHFGKSAFNGLGVSGGLTQEQQNANLQAINDLLTKWPTNRIDPYLLAIENGKIKIDWEQSLEFNPNIGLVSRK